MKIASQNSSAQSTQITNKAESLSPSLDLSQIAQTSQRGAGESLYRPYDEYFYWWNQHPPKEGGAKAFILSPKN
jgi:hypothetical protein